MIDKDEDIAKRLKEEAKEWARYLASVDPTLYPGLWDSAVDNVKALRSGSYALKSGVPKPPGYISHKAHANK